MRLNYYKISVKMHVTFQIKDAKTNLGQSVFVLGNKAELGEWKINKAIPL